MEASGTPFDRLMVPNEVEGCPWPLHVAEHAVNMENTEMAGLTAVKKVIGEGERFSIAGHVYPDGDAIGSSIAFLHLLRTLGKKATAVMPAAVPPEYSFLDRENDIIVYDSDDRRHDRLFHGLDALFMLDSSTNDRLGPLYDLARRSGIFRVAIDHHPDNTADADLKIIDPDACSTAQIVYEMYGEFGLPIGREAAEALYAGIHTDTVSFNFLGTSARTHEIAAHLLALGVDPKKMWLKIYGNDSPRLLALAGRALSGLTMEDGGTIVWFAVREEEWRELGVHPNETESFTRYPLTIRGVGVVALFCEEGPGRTRVCLRALDDTDVGKIARSLGGGGHRTSAGASVDRGLETVVGEVLGEIRKERGTRG